MDHPGQHEAAWATAPTTEFAKKRIETSNITQLPFGEIFSFNNETGLTRG
jgi:hypothetical protein